MPQTVPCPNDDHGICTIPDPALVISKKGISVVSPDLAEHLLEVSEAPQSLRPLNLSISYDQLLTEAAGVSAGGGEQAESATAEHLRSLLGPTGRTVVVNCSCGDFFVTDV